MSSIKAPYKTVLEVGADLVEWALRVPVSTPDFMRIVFSPPDIVEETTGFWRYIKLSNSWEYSSPDLHFSLRTIHSSKVLTPSHHEYTPSKCWFSCSESLSELFWDSRYNFQVFMRYKFSQNSNYNNSTIRFTNKVERGWRIRLLVEMTKWSLETQY